MPIVHIEKLVFGGQGLAKIDGKAVFVWNALPGEEVEIQYLKNKKDFAEAVAVKIINPSPDRIEPKENHYLSSAPWEMMTAEAENRYKKQVSLETYERNGGLILPDEAVDLVFDEENQYGYRNKIEFSFAVLDSGEVALSFFNRGTKVRLPITSSLLSEPVINEVSASILDWINQEKIPMRSLKSIIVRSNGRGQAIAALFIKDRLIFDNYPDVNDKMLGFTLYYSTHKSPASVPTELLYQAGQDFLEA
ncbi:MAG: TRAM domain-containing protein, partial [Patescibacteria group bacterium]